MFENINTTEVSDTIKKNTYFHQESAISREQIHQINSELNLWNFKLNSNEILPVKTFNGWFHSMAIARSKTVYDIVTNEKIIGICKNYIGDKFRLKAHRVYSITSGAKMPWHTDDKAYGVKKDFKGLIFILYLKDVYKGEFQIIKDSAEISKKYDSPKIEDSAIQKFHKDKIIDFKSPAGSLIIYDHRAIHRAKPYFDPFWYRTSLFIQVDNNLADSEKIILNSSFISNMNEDIKKYLGFGMNSGMPHEPTNTGYKTLSYKLLISIIVKCIFSITLIKPFYLFRRSQILKILKKLIKKS
tara:strand:+ start:329 stop:1225 length:897 start_codon:yes stop_codon:yes gene_type:complete